MQIRGRPIGPSHPPYVIAEVSCNHAGSEAVAHALIQVAKQAGAEAVKFQFYTPEGMVGEPVNMVGFGGFKSDLVVQGGPWNGEKMYSLYHRSQMPWEWGPRLKSHCHDLGLAFIASAYDVDGLNWLMENCVPDALKVASFEATDTPFVEAVMDKGLPTIISLGMGGGGRALRDVFRKRKYGLHPLVLLHCVSAYPTAPSEAFLSGVDLGLSFYNVFDAKTGDGTPIFQRGFSDHTIGHAVACAAVAKGAYVLEKHIQLHPALKTADSHFSATPEEFTAYCQNVKSAWQACQPPVGDAEKDSRQFRRAPGGKRGSYGQ